MKRKLFSVLLALVLVLSFSLVTAVPVAAADYYINPGDSIQAAVDGAQAGDTIILDGTFDDYSTVTVGTSDITIKAASSAILDGGSGPAFRLADGVSNVTIEGLEICNRTGSRGGGIEAWDVSTSYITIRSNNIHDNTYNGILVGSEGGYIHTNWMVKNNTVVDNGFAGIELTNAQGSKIMNNDVDGGVLGIVVQARSTGYGGTGSYDVAINAVKVLRNTVDNASYGIYILSFTGHPIDFSPITGASSLLTNVTVNNNTITGSGVGVIFWSYNAAATARNATINHNSITDASTGVMVLEAGSGQVGTVKNVKVVNNAFNDCDTDVIDTGEDTKTPPGPF